MSRQESIREPNPPGKTALYGSFLSQHQNREGLIEKINNEPFQKARLDLKKKERKEKRRKEKRKKKEKKTASDKGILYTNPSTDNVYQFHRASYQLPVQSVFLSIPFSVTQ